MFIRFIASFITLFAIVSCSRCTRSTSVSNEKPLAVENTEGLNGKVFFTFSNKSEDPLAESGDYRVENKVVDQDLQIKDLENRMSKLLEQISNGELTENSYLVGALETEIFHRKLKLIRENIKKQPLFKEARKLEINVQDYINRYVYEGLEERVTEEEVTAFLEGSVVPDGEVRKTWALKQILKNKKDKATSYFVEKYLLDLPVKVNLKTPEFPLEIRYEWTPSWGPENSPVQVMIFSGTRNAPERKLIKEVVGLKDKFKNLYVGFRPVYSGKDPFQDLSFYMNLCVWQQHPEKYWDYLSQSVGDFKEETENKLYDIAKKNAMDIKSLRSCVVNQTYKEAVDYHKKYAQYLGIESGPVVFVGGEVLHGAVTLNKIQEILYRRLKIPSAAVWR